MNIKKPELIFLGTPDFALPALKRLMASDFKPSLVITQPDQPVGRRQELTPPPVKVLANQNKIKVLQPATKKELADIFRKNFCDVAIVVAYGMILPASVLATPKHGFLNIHPSLLPKYRGSSPIQSALLNGEKETGVTVMKLTEKMDAGPILVSQGFKITDQNASQLHDLLAELGAELLVKVLPDYLSNKIDLMPQDDSRATYTKIIKREDGLINWGKSAELIFNQFRAFNPWPGVFTYLAGKRLKISNLSVFSGNLKQDDSPHGTVFLSTDKDLVVKCGEGYIKLDKIQLEGKKETTASEFLKGHQDVINQVLG